MIWHVLIASNPHVQGLNPDQWISSGTSRTAHLHRTGAAQLAVLTYSKPIQCIYKIHGIYSNPLTKIAQI